MTRIALIMLLSVCTFGCEKKTTQAKVEAERDKEQARREVNEFAALHNAVTDWRESIGDGNPLHKTWSIDVEESLVRSNEEPVAFTCNIEDIVVRQGKYIARFYDPLRWRLRFYSTDIRFDLECTKEQIAAIRSHAPERSPRLYCHFVVVAVISGIHKVRFAVSASSTLNSEDAEVKIESPDVFIAKGRCVAVKRLSVPLLDLPQRMISN